MKIIDFIILVPVVWGMYKGFSRGLISEVAQFAALVLGVMLGSKLSWLLSGLLINLGLSEKVIPVVAFALIFILILLGVFLLAKILTKTVKSISLGWLNKLGGIILGGGKFLLVIGIVLQLIVSNDTKGRIISHETRENSVLLPATLKTTAFLSPYLKKALFDADDENCETDTE